MASILSRPQWIKIMQPNMDHLWHDEFDLRYIPPSHNTPVIRRKLKYSKTSFVYNINFRPF